jgi:hypothetical protein
MLAEARERTEHGFGYPRFIEKAFRSYLDCGALPRGFVRLKCWNLSYGSSRPKVSQDLFDDRCVVQEGDDCHRPPHTALTRTREPVR